MDQIQRSRLKDTIRQWAGVDVEILIVDRTQMEVRVEKQGLRLP